MKTCKECGVEKSLEDFYTYKHSGKVTYYARCKPCHRERLKRITPDGRKKEIRQLHRKRTIEKVNELKKVPCADCNKSYPPYVMDFDHVRGTKVKGIAAMIARNTWAEVEAEIAKCEVVCSNCHRERTHQRVRN